MQPEDEICYCYHVSLRKLVNFSRRTKPVRPSEMTGCLGAGTGCGWCIPFLIKLAHNPDALALEGVTPEAYATRRTEYRSGQTKHAFNDTRPDNEAHTHGTDQAQGVTS